ncbi:MAG: EAL domain-containing protein [Caulobacteraceae bacterium]
MSIAEASNMDSLEHIIWNRNIRTFFQPIVSLSNGATIGYEALTRGPAGGRYERPDNLFGAASEHNMLWELEYLCRQKAIERAKDMPAGEKLFINVDPKVILDERYKIGFTKELLSSNHIDPTDIVFEITEKTCINDYNGFLKVINNYISQGYTVAIDDTGAGYSGLRMLAEINPQYIKIDMELVRNIEKKAINRALIKALSEFAYATGIHVIAEGIETPDELNTLIGLGIEYGQGFLFRKPTEDFAEIDPDAADIIFHNRYSKVPYSLESAL